METILEFMCCSSPVRVSRYTSSPSSLPIRKVRTEDNLQDLLGNAKVCAKEHQNDRRASLLYKPHAEKNMCRHLSRSSPIAIPHKGSIRSLYCRKKLQSAIERKMYPNEMDSTGDFIPPHLCSYVEADEELCTASCM